MYNCATTVICVILLKNKNVRNMVATFGFYQTNFVDTDYISIAGILKNFMFM